MPETGRNHELFTLERQIDTELRSMEKNISGLTEAELSDHDIFLDYQRKLSHIHNLFDQASEHLRDLELDHSDPDFYELLETKQRVSVHYGALRRLQNAVNRLFGRDQGREEELERFRSDLADDDREEESALPPEPETEPDEDDLEAARLAAEEEAATRAEKDEKRKADRRRQEQFRKEGREAEQKAQDEFAARQRARQEEDARRAAQSGAAGYLGNDPYRTEDERRRFEERTSQERFQTEQRLRQEEAAKLGMRAGETNLVSEADLRAERYRQEDARRQEELAGQQRREHDRRVMDDYRRRMDESDGYVQQQKNHFDFGRPDQQKAPDGPSSDHESARWTPSPASTPEPRAEEYRPLSDHRPQDPGVRFDDRRREFDSQPYQQGAPHYDHRPEQPRHADNPSYGTKSPDYSRPSEPTPTVRPEEPRRQEHDRRAEDESRRQAQQKAPNAPSQEPSRYDAPPSKPVTAADRRTAEYRAEDERRARERHEEDRRAAHHDTMSQYRERTAQTQRSFDDAKGHFDFSGGRNAKPDTSGTSSPDAAPRHDNKPQGSSSPNNYSPDPHLGEPRRESRPQPDSSGDHSPKVFHFVPGGVAEGSAHSRTSSDLIRSSDAASADNRRIYSAISSSADTASGKPSSISPAYEAQMRYNLDRARMAYQEKRGTPEAKEAAQSYIAQRTAYMKLRSDINQGRVQIERPKVMSTEAATQQPKGTAKTAPSVFCQYTPNGVQSRLIENAQLTGTQHEVVKPGQTGRFRYTQSNPLVVNPAYEAALKARADRATAVMNNAVVVSKARGTTVRVNPRMNDEVQVATAAYIGFQRAKQSGQVVVSGDSDRRSPDYQVWQQRYHQSQAAAGKMANGTTGQSKGANPNKVTKEAVEEVTADIFGKSSKLKREGTIAHYGKKIGYRLEGWSSVAISRASRKLYNMAQSGDEDAPESLRTFEQGRYYMNTTVGVGRAIKNFHVVNAQGAAKTAQNLELKRFGKYVDMDKHQLSQQIHTGIANNRALKREIKDMMRQGSTLTPDQRKELLSKMKQLTKSSLETNCAVSYRNFQRQNANKIEASKDLEARRNVLTTRKQVDAAIKSLRKKEERKMAKKFGDRMTITDKSLARQIQQMKTQGREMKGMIKALEAKGSGLTLSERKQLSKLIKKHKELSAELRNLAGMRDARRKLHAMLSPYMKMRQTIIQNANAWASGGYMIYGFLLRGLREGGEIGTSGLAKAADIATNRHVRSLVKKTFKASYKTSAWIAKKTGLEKAAKKAAVKTAKAVANSSTGQAVKAGAELTKATIKTAVNTTKTAATRMTPKFVKTAVSKTAKGHAVVRGAIDKAKKRVAKSTFGRAASAVSRNVAKVTQAVSKFLSGLKIILIKAGLYLLAGILIVALVVGVVETITSAVSSMIMGTETKDDRIDLSKYVEIINKEEQEFNATINLLKNDSAYDHVYVSYATSITDNTREMLSMLAVRADQDLDLLSNSFVKKYLKSLYADSHKLVTRVESYTCSGCKFVHFPISDTTYWYCDGHKDLYVDINVLGFDAIFTADSMGNADVGGAAAGDLIGTAKVTYYCTEKYPHICNAGPPYKTATGTTPTPGRTIAVDPAKIPLNSHVVIDGHEYVAEDTGGAIDGMRIDIVVSTHAEALRKGTRYNVPVYWAIREGGGSRDTGKWTGWTEDNIEWCKLIYQQDWSELYSGVPNVTDVVGNETDLSGVTFVDGDRPGNSALVNKALSQVGNVGGQPYWSWYGYSYRVEWCATFVSWVANQQGVLNRAVPKFASCNNEGVPWFKSRGQWAKRGDVTPVAGDIIFFDWDKNGSANHVGIVVGTDGTNVYTVEGNSRDKVRTKSYPLNSPLILGYGLPNY